jgi:ABC-type branched-subunit amino acid transport system substrate-binding protein
MNHKIYGFFLLCILCIALCIATSATNPPDNTLLNVSTTASFQENTEKIPVGILVMQSGFVSDIGKEYERAFEMVKQDNPDSSILPIVVDAGSNVTTAISAWNTLKSEYPNLSIVVTVASWTTNVVYPDAADDGMVHIALGSAVVNRSRSVDYLVRLTPGVEQESPIIAEYLDQYDRVAILGGNNELSGGYITALKSRIPEKIVNIELYDPDTLPDSLNLTSVRDSYPDVILLLSVSEAGTIVDMIRNYYISVPLVGTRVIERNTLLENPAANGLIFTTPALNLSDPFFSRFRETCGEEATFYGAEGFDAMKILYPAVDGCGNDPECLGSRFMKNQYNGSLGEVQFDENRVAFYPIEFRIIRDGHFESYDWIKPV